MPSATLISPMKTVSSGLLGCRGATSTSARAVAVGSLIAWGVRMASTPSQPGSSMRAGRGGRVARGVGVSGHVDRIAARGEAREAALEVLVGLGLSSASSPPSESRRSTP